MSMRYPGGLIATTPVNQQYPSGVWTGPQTTPYQANNVWANDSSFKNTTLLLHGDGATTSFTRDASTNNFQLSLAGDTRPNNFTPYIENGYWSNYFDGAGDYISGASWSAAGNFGTSSFTVECWVYITGAPQSNQVIWSCNAYPATSGLILQYTGSGATQLNVASGSSGTVISSSAGWSFNEWHHVAVVRSGTTLTLYIDGTSRGSTTFSNNCTDGLQYIGRPSDIADYMVQGYISNFRIVKGTAVYTGNFTPPTTPLTAISGTSVLTCQSNRFIDNSSNAYTTTPSGNTAVTMQQPFAAPSATLQYGSGYFDGSGDYVSAPSNSAYQFGSGDFTIECWAYMTGAAQQFFFAQWNSPNRSWGLLVRNSGTTLSFVYSTTGSNETSIDGTIAAQAGRWAHFAAVRNGNTLTTYMNGVSVASASVSGVTLYSATQAVEIGRNPEATGSWNFTGYMTNCRIVKGTAVYTSAFTPPTAPLTPVSGTSLLTLQTNGPENNNGFLDSSLNSLPVTRNGNTTQGSFTPYESNGYWSNYFDGSGDYLSTAYNSAFSLTGNFTVEFWVNFSAHGNYGGMVGCCQSGSLIGWQVIFNSTSNNILIEYTGGGFTSSIALTPNQWNHVALVRSGSSIVLYLNGVSAGTATSSATFDSGSSPLLIGVERTFAFYTTGYISNVRVVKGTAVYTSEFTPPTAPLTAITNTSLLTCQSNRFLDNSTNAYTVTKNGDTSVQPFQPFAPTVQYTPSTLGGSGYFDGNGDYLSVADAIAFDFAGDFTVEGYYYFIQVNQSNGATILFNANILDRFQLATENNVITFRLNGSLIINTAYTSANLLNTWTHIAIVRTGSTVALFVNGARLATGTSSASCDISVAYIGIQTPGYSNHYFNGYMSSLRVVKGSGPYNATQTTLTVPTSPPTAITNTSLLCNFTNAAIFDNSGMSNLETVGNAQIDTSVVKYGTSSLYFDGSGDWLIPSGSSALYAFGTGDFTIEFWIYVATTQTSIIYDSRPSSTQGAYPELYLASNQINYYHSSAIQISGVTLANTTWYHIALCRSGTSTKLFVNGTQVGSTYSDSTNYLCGTNRPTIGVAGNNLADPFNGYLDDLRVTKGVARYVTNFTPPVARMPNQ